MKVHLKILMYVFAKKNNLLIVTAICHKRITLVTSLKNKDIISINRDLGVNLGLMQDGPLFSVGSTIIISEL